MTNWNTKLSEEKLLRDSEIIYFIQLAVTGICCCALGVNERLQIDVYKIKDEPCIYDKLNESSCWEEETE